tara:strand:+ start:2423 stop:2593 length:171 start_codon:yes stop_codon:yes gene_type:complete
MDFVDYENLTEEQQAHQDATWDYQQQLEEEAQRKENECVCGTINCSTEYSCHTSGY